MNPLILEIYAVLQHILVSDLSTSLGVDIVNILRKECFVILDIPALNAFLYVD